MCDCIRDINRQIGDAHNAILVTTLFGEQKAVINTERLRTTAKRSPKPPVMIATHCPFCGSPYGQSAPQGTSHD